MFSGNAYGEWERIGSKEYASIYFDYKKLKSLEQDYVSIYYDKNNFKKKKHTLIFKQLIDFKKPDEVWLNSKSAEVQLEIFCYAGSGKIIYNFHKITLFDDQMGKGKILLDTDDEKQWPKDLQVGIFVSKSGVKWGTFFKQDSIYRFVESLCFKYNMHPTG